MAELTLRERLNAVHEVLLRTHKALIEWEKRRYEGVHGKVGSPYVLLQLLINDQQFAWLRRMSELIVQIDEYVSSREAVEVEAGEALLGEVRRLIDVKGEGEFQRNYREAVEGDGEVAALHGELGGVVG